MIENHIFHKPQTLHIAQKNLALSTSLCSTCNTDSDLASQVYFGFGEG